MTDLCGLEPAEFFEIELAEAKRQYAEALEGMRVAVERLKCLAAIFDDKKFANENSACQDQIRRLIAHLRDQGLVAIDGERTSKRPWWLNPSLPPDPEAMTALNQRLDSARVL